MFEWVLFSLFRNKQNALPFKYFKSLFFQNQQMVTSKVEDNQQCEENDLLNVVLQWVDRLDDEFEVRFCDKFCLELDGQDSRIQMTNMKWI
jgi:hypothetical protein